MKISELAQIARIRRDIRIPLAIQGENMSVTMGQILDAISQDVVAFDIIRGGGGSVQYAPGSPTVSTGSVIFDNTTGKFYLATSSTIPSAGMTITTWTYFQNWLTRDSYYGDDGEVREDCLFRAEGGRLYYYEDGKLKSAGVTDEQAKQIRHSTPIKVESEDKMNELIDIGAVEDGQLYYVAE